MFLCKLSLSLIVYYYIAVRQTYIIITSALHCATTGYRLLKGSPAVFTMTIQRHGTVSRRDLIGCRFKNILHILGRQKRGTSMQLVTQHSQSSESDIEL